MASLRSHLTSTPSQRDRFNNPVLLVWGYLVSLGDKLQSEMESLFSSSGNSSSSSSSSNTSSHASAPAAADSNTSSTSFSASSASSSLSAWLGRTVLHSSQDPEHQQQQQQQQKIRRGEEEQQQQQQQQHGNKEPPSRQQQQTYTVWGFSLSDLLRKLSPSSPPASSARRSNRTQQQQQQQQQTGASTATAPSTPSAAAVNNNNDSAVAGEGSTSSVRAGCCWCSSSSSSSTVDHSCSQKLLPPATRKRARATDKTLVLDLDETLIHARPDVREMGEGRFDFMVLLSEQRQQQRQHQPELQHQQQQLQHQHSSSSCKRNLLQALGSKKRSLEAPAAAAGNEEAYSVKGEQQKQQQKRSPAHRRVYVRKRPHLREFLEAASELFEVVLFTAAREEFANAVMEHLDPEGNLVDHVLSRESCTRLNKDKMDGGSKNRSGGGRRRRRKKKGGGGGGGGGDFDDGGRSSGKKRGPTSMVKDLGIIGRPLSKVIMVENSLDAIRYHLENGVQISSFYGDGEDSELLSTLDALRALAPAADVRDGIIRLSVETQARKEGKMVMLDNALLTTG